MTSVFRRGKEVDFMDIGKPLIVFICLEQGSCITWFLLRKAFGINGKVLTEICEKRFGVVNYSVCKIVDSL
jgi:hypothetical protein